MTLARFLTGTLALGILALSIPIQAQAPGAAAPPLMRLNILALDAKGQPVSDLNAADLQVVDQGKPQRIVYFHRKAAAAAGQTEPGVLSNRATRIPHATAILFDLIGQGRPDALRAYKMVGHSLQQLESGESVYLYVLAMDGSLVPVHPIPPDPSVPAADDKTWTQQIESQFDTLMKSMIRGRPAGLGEEDFSKRTYVAMETLARQLVFFSGERNILWVMKDVHTVSNPKGTCSGDWLDCALYVQHLAVTLERTNVPVNPVNYTNISDVNTNRGMVEFAGMVGGRPFFGDDVRAILSKFASDPVGGYVLGYEAPPENFDNKFHRVKVTCERKGVKIEVRQRYYAFPDGRPPMARAQDALLAAIRSPFDDPQIGLRVTASPVSGAQKAIHLKVQIDPSDLSLREEGGFSTGHLTALVAGYTAGGVAGAPVPADFNLRLTKEQRETAAKNGLPFEQDFPLDNATTKVRVLVYDHSTGAVGSLSVPVGASQP
jgi:VWFA-related protein